MQGYVPGEQPREGNFIKLNTNENPYPSSPAVQRAIGRAIQAGLQKYPDPMATAFRAAPAELLGVEPNWILCGNGSDDILTIVTRAFVGQGDRLRLPYPSYILYKTLAQLQGAEAEEIQFQPDWSLGDDFRQPAAGLKLAYSAEPEQSVRHDDFAGAEFANWPTALPCPLLVDEAYVDFAETNCVALVAENEKILVTRSLSKSYALAGLRFGYIVAQPQMIEQLDEGEGFVQLRCAVDRRRHGRDRRSGVAGRKSAKSRWPRAARLTAGMRELGFRHGRFAS